jgi:hypothetical protein
MNLRSKALLFAALFFLFAGVTMVWLKLDRAPPNWDDAWYLTNSLVLYDALADGGVAGFGREFLNVLDFKAPLITALPTPFYLIFGRDWHAAYLVNLTAMFLLFASVFWIGNRLRGPRAGLMAIFVTGTMPLLYGLSRWYLVEYTLTALVAATMCVVIVLSDRLDTLRVAVTFGLLASFGFLLKVVYPIFVLTPFLSALWRSKYRLRFVLAASIPFVIIAAPWYSLHWHRTLEYALSAAYGKSAIIYGTGTIFSWQAISTYLARLAQEGISLYYIVLAMLLGGILVIRRRSDTLRTLVPLATWALPFLFFLFGANKDLRLAAPLLPAFALAFAICLDIAIEQRTWIALPLLTFPAIQMMSTSFGWPYDGPRLGYARKPTDDSWQHERILDVIGKSEVFRAGDKKLLLVGTDRAWFNANNFELATVAAKLPLDVASTAYENDRNAALRLADSAAFFVYKEGGEPESEFFNQHAREVIQHVRGSPDFEELPYGQVLPDGGVVHIWRRSLQGAFLRAGLQKLPAFGASFGGLLELTGFLAERNDDVLIVRYGWRSISQPPREYWCFTHVLTENGKILGYLDHRVLDGNPPMTSWRIGDTAVEERRFKLPAEAVGAEVMLRLGLYDPPSGDRLPVSVSEREGATVVDDGTALNVRVPVP